VACASGVRASLASLKERVARLSDELRQLQEELESAVANETARGEGEVCAGGGRGSRGEGGVLVVPLFKGLDYVDGPTRLYYLANVVSAEERAHVVGLLEPRLGPSEVMSYSSQETADKKDAYTRSSETAHSPTALEVEDGVLSRVIDRLHALARMPRHRGENFQMTRYRTGERYVFHYDSSLDVGRLLTTLLFLSDVASGGATVFPHGRLTERGRLKLALLAHGRAAEVVALDGVVSDAWHSLSAEDFAFRTTALLPPLLEEAKSLLHASPLARNASAARQALPALPESVGNLFRLDITPFCEHPDVLKILPRAGDGILWFNHEPDLTMDKRALHGGCPPTDGASKTIAQRWMRFYDAVEGNRYAKLMRKCLGTH
jgi:2OG-Fe(II) oxygenase superfamily